MKIYTYGEALKESLDYFKGNELAAKVFIDKYALRNEKDELLESNPDQMHRRIAKEFARIEKGKFKSPLDEETIYELLKDFKWIIPAGSPMYGIGNKYVYSSISNCFLLDIPLDSYNSILEVDKQLVNISKRRGGVATDLSNLRPQGSTTQNSARSSTGITSWMERYSNSVREVCQGGRRAAGLLSISVHHPDIIDFCTIKNDITKATGVNVSVKLTQEFINALQNDEEYELRFPVDSNTPTISQTIKAKDVWNIIVKSSWNTGDPGLLFWNIIERDTPSDCYKEYKTQGTNTCSELILSPLESCRLMSLNLLSFVDDPFTYKSTINYNHLYEYSSIIQRLMDNIVDLESEKIDLILKKIEKDPEPDYLKESEKRMWTEIKRKNDEGRRTGVGIIGLGDTIAALGLKYGSNRSIEITEEIYRTIKLGCYSSSVQMAKELGTFKGYDWEKEKKCPFLLRIKDDDPKLYKEMKESGRRNIALTATAPTGTLSLLTQTTSGIEPVFELKHIRRRKINPEDENVNVDFVDQNGDKWQNYDVVHPTLQKWMEVTGETDLEKSPWWGSCANDIDYKKKIKLLAAAQKHTCHNISCTFNLPKDATIEDVDSIYRLAIENELKGITVYRDGCRSGVLLKEKPFPDERPKELECDVHHLTVVGEEYLVLVGKVGNRPYEVFSCKNGIIPKNVKVGKIIKKRKDFYKAEFENDYELSPIIGSCSETQECVSRLVSALLRNNVEMHFIVEQLEKVGERRSNLHSYARSLSRALKKYIPENTKMDSECPECGSGLVRIGGCPTCINSCGYSKCL